MGDQADQAQQQWDSAGRPSFEEAEPEYAAWAKDIAAKHHADAVRMKRADPEHADCQGSPKFDPMLGVVCYCGDIIGTLDFEEVQRPPSATTAAAETAKGLAVQRVEAAVATVDGISSAIEPADPILASVDIIDPTQPYDSKMVEEHLLDAVARLERGAHFERVCAEQYARAVLDYEKAYQRALLKADSQGGAADIRKARAFTSTEHEYDVRMVAKMKLDAIQGTMHSLRSVISAYQSVAKSIASTYSAGGSPGRMQF